jgi:uncharacterized protein with HEPN domain
MAALTPLDRAQHVKDTIQELRQSIAPHTLDTLRARPLELAGFKYLLMVISEAVRNIPKEWRAEFGATLDWVNASNLGNVLRHAYHDVNATVLWETYEHDLDPLEAAIDRMIEAHATPPRSPSS